MRRSNNVCGCRAAVPQPPMDPCVPTMHRDAVCQTQILFVRNISEALPTSPNWFGRDRPVFDQRVTHPLLAIVLHSGGHAQPTEIANQFEAECIEPGGTH